MARHKCKACSGSDRAPWSPGTSAGSLPGNVRSEIAGIPAAPSDGTAAVVAACPVSPGGAATNACMPSSASNTGTMSSNRSSTR